MIKAGLLRLTAFTGGTLPWIDGWENLWVTSNDISPKYMDSLDTLQKKKAIMMINSFSVQGSCHKDINRVGASWSNMYGITWMTPLSSKIGSTFSHCNEWMPHDAFTTCPLQHRSEAYTYHIYMRLGIHLVLILRWAHQPGISHMHMDWLCCYTLVLLLTDLQW